MDKSLEFYEIPPEMKLEDVTCDMGVITERLV